MLLSDGQCRVRRVEDEDEVRVVVGDVQEVFRCRYVERRWSEASGVSIATIKTGSGDPEAVRKVYVRVSVKPSYGTG